MENKATTMLAGLLIVGLVVGAGVGYFVASSKTETQIETITIETHPFEGKTIQIGYIAPDGLEPRSTFLQDLVLRDINEYTDILGYDVSFDWAIEDATGLETVHLEKVQGFHSLGINVFLGGAWSDMASLALNYVNDNDMLMISESSTYPELAIEGDNLFRFCTPDLGQVAALVDMVTSWGVTHAAVIDSPDAGWTEPYFNAFKEGFESRGGTIIARSISNPVLDEAIGEAISEHGQDRVCVAAVVWVPSFAIRQTEEFSNLRKVVWMGLGDLGKDPDIIMGANGLQTELRLFSPLESTALAGKWDTFESEYADVVGEAADIYDGVAYDAAYCIAISMLETQSDEALLVKELLPQVGYSYYGVTGRCDLDSAGDRIPDAYDIWGYAEVDGVDTYLKYGECIVRDRHDVFWSSEALTSQGLSIP